MRLNHSGTALSDRLVAPTINLGGTLIITKQRRPLACGRYLYALQRRSHLSGFGSVVLPNYYTFDTTQLAGNGTITVTGIAALPSFTPDFQHVPHRWNYHVQPAPMACPETAFSVLSSTTIVTTPLGAWTNVVSGNFDVLRHITQR